MALRAKSNLNNDVAWVPREGTFEWYKGEQQGAKKVIAVHGWAVKKCMCPDIHEYAQAPT